MTGSLLALLLFFILLASFFCVATSKQAAPVGLNPLGTPCEQLHFLALLRFFPLYDFLNFLLLSIFLQTLLPFLLKLVKFIEFVFQLLVQRFKFSTLLVQFRIICLYT